MASSDSGNAMTEIALALAMAFFAIMILTMVSMGAGGQGHRVATAQTAASPEQMQLLPSSDAGRDSKSARVLKPWQLIIFRDGQFFDDRLQVLGLRKIAAMKDPVLAVSPDLTLAQIMAAKGRLALPGLPVTTLNRQWLDAIKEHKK